MRLSESMTLVNAPARVVTPVASLRVRWQLRYAASMALVLSALALIDATRSFLPGGGVFLLLLIPVMANAIAYGFGPGLLTVLSGAVGAVLLVHLRAHPWLDEPAGVTRVILFLVEGLFMVFLSSALRTAVAQRLHASPPTAASATVGLPEPLTTRELEVLRLAATGMPVADIGRHLYLSRNTVKSHLAHAYAKLGAHNRTEAIAAGLQSGCLEPDLLMGPTSLSA